MKSCKTLIFLFSDKDKITPMGDDNISVRDIRNAGWFWIQNEIILTYGAKIGAYGVAVYNVLAQCARNESSLSKTTMRQIATLLGISPQSAMRSLEKLIEHGLVREVKKSLSPSQGPSEYALLSVPIGNGGNGSVPIGNASVPVGNGSVPIGNTYKTINTVNTKEEIHNTSKEGFSLVPEQSNGKPKKHTRGLEKPCDPRCKAVTDKIFEAYKHFNKVNPGWGDAPGKQLKTFLASHPDWNEEKIFDCIRNRFKSEVNLAQEPLSWISKLGDYASGPLDKFGNPKSNGNGSHNGHQSHTNGSGTTGHLLDHLPDADEIERRRKADDKRLEERRNARGM